MKQKIGDYEFNISNGRLVREPKKSLFQRFYIPAKKISYLGIVTGLFVETYGFFTGDSSLHHMGVDILLPSLAYYWGTEFGQRFMGETFASELEKLSEENEKLKKQKSKLTSLQQPDSLD